MFRQKPRSAPHVEVTYTDAFEATAKERAALPASALLVLNLDPIAAASTVMTAAMLAKLRSLRSQIVESLPKQDLAQFDKIETYAAALWHAQTRCKDAAATFDAAPELLPKAVEIRDIFIADATALAKRRFIDSRRLDELNRGNGFRNVSKDIALLVMIFRGAWATVSGSTAMKEADLEEAEQVYIRLSKTVTKRNSQPARVAIAADDRTRAFTLFVNAYAAARRAAQYLRSDADDVDTFLPSLWTGRGGRGGGAKPKSPSRSLRRETTASPPRRDERGGATDTVRGPTSALVDVDHLCLQGVHDVSDKAVGDRRARARPRAGRSSWMLLALAPGVRHWGPAGRVHARLERPPQPQRVDRDAAKPGAR